MLSFLKALRRDKRGNVLVLTGAALPLIVGSAGLATDTIQWALWKRDLQRAADSAAIAGVYHRIQTDGTDGVDDAIDDDLTLTQNIGMALEGDPEIAFPADDAGADMVDQVQVTLRVKKALTFSSMFMSEAPTIQAVSTAASVPGTDDYCVVALETDPTRTGITIGGNAKIEMSCGMISNSASINQCLRNNGNASSVSATVMACVGGLQYSRNWNVPRYEPYSEAAEDPYADLNVDRAELAGNRCFSITSGSNTRLPLLGTSTSSNFNGSNATVTLDDARTLSGNATLSCFRGLSVPSGGTLTLPAGGTYYIGEAGADIQGTLNCQNCTLVLTRINTSAAVGTIRVNSSGLVNISAPTVVGDPYRGVAIFQDRNATDNTNQNRINGNSAQYITGAVYFPKQEITFNGGGTSSNVCMRLVARRLIITGNAGQTLTQKFEREGDCDLFSNDEIGGGRRVRLIA
jgi:Flp pilus assembly protein TadG